MVGCSLHHPQPRGDLRIAAHTRPTADCPQGRSCPGSLPSQGDLLDLVSPLKVGPGWIHPHPQSVCRPPTWAPAAQRPGEGSRRRRKSFGKTRHPRWLSGCWLSGSDRVIPKPSLSEAGSCPALQALGCSEGQGEPAWAGSLAVSQPAQRRCRGPHPLCGQAAMIPILSQEASRYF